MAILATSIFVKQPVPRDRRIRNWGKRFRSGAYRGERLGLAT